MITGKSSRGSRSYYRLQALKKLHFFELRPEFKEVITGHKNFNLGALFGDVYGVGSIYEKGILECDNNKFFSDEQVKQLLKYKMLGYNGIYLFEDGFGLVIDSNTPYGISLKGINYIYANLANYTLCSDINIRGLYGSRCKFSGKSITITECLDIREVKEQRLNIDRANNIFVDMCNNIWLNCINLDDCTAVMSDVNLLHLGIKNSNYIDLAFSRCEKVSLYLENTKGKITINNSSVFIAFNETSKLDSIKIDIAKGSRVRLMSPTKIKITIVDRKSESEPFSGYASELIKKLMENNNEIQC